MRFEVVGAVAGDNRYTVVQTGGRDNQIRLREGVSGLTTFLDQQPPFEHDVFCDRQEAGL